MQSQQDIHLWKFLGVEREGARQRGEADSQMVSTPRTSRALHLSALIQAPVRLLHQAQPYLPGTACESPRISHGEEFMTQSQAEGFLVTPLAFSLKHRVQGGVSRGNDRSAPPNPGRKGKDNSFRQRAFVIRTKTCHGLVIGHHPLLAPAPTFFLLINRQREY